MNWLMVVVNGLLLSVVIAICTFYFVRGLAQSFVKGEQQAVMDNPYMEKVISDIQATNTTIEFADFV